MNYQHVALSCAIHPLTKRIMSKPGKYAKDGEVFVPASDMVSQDFSMEKKKMELILNAGGSMTTDLL